MFQRFSVRFY